ncbi:MAG: alpha/beta hydrolase, partial [Candidatus Binatia bacterium]
EAILEYSPIDVVDKISPRGVLFIAVENDAVTPEEQSVQMYEKAGEPKKLVIYKKTTHYGIYNDYFEDVAANVVDWYNQHLKSAKVETREKR